MDEIPYISDNLKRLIRRMLSDNIKQRPSADEILTQFVPGRAELELKWEKLQHKLLNSKFQELQIKEKDSHLRRNSF